VVHALAIALVAYAIGPPAHDAAHSTTVYYGKAAGDEARVRLTYLPGNTRARIRLAPPQAAQASERLVRLHCGQGTYGRKALATVRWPKGKRAKEISLGRAIDAVDRCRVSSRASFLISMSMRRLTG
jgi:hypothetical protein